MNRMHSTRYLWIALLGLAFVAGCGEAEDSGGGKAGGGDGGGDVGPPAVADAPPRVPVDPERVRLLDWEWYRRARESLPEIRGVAVRPDGEPAPDATATVLIPAPVPTGIPRRLDTHPVGEDGSFVHRDVPGNAWISVEAPGLAGTITAATNLVVREARETTRVALRKTGEITGVVQLESGEPLAGASVMARAGAPLWFAVAKADDQGRYSMTGVPVGPVGVAFNGETYVGNSGEVTVEEGKTVEADIVARKVPPFIGRLVDEDTGEPISGAAISIFSNREVIVTSNEEGEFRLDGVFLPVFSVWADGYSEQVMSLNPDRREEQTVTEKLRKGGRVLGRILDPDGQPAAGVRVNAYPHPREGHPPIRGPVTGADGTFSFGWIPVASEGVTEVVLGADRPDTVGGSSRLLNLRAGETVRDVEIRMEAPSGLTLSVRDDAGEPIAGATVEVVEDNSPDDAIAAIFAREAEGRTDETGRVTVGGLRGGPHLVVIRPEQRIPFYHRVSLDSGAVLEPEEPVVLPRRLALAGRVRGTEEKIPDEIQLALTNPAMRLEHEIAVREDGTFRVEGLPPGRYKLRANSAEYEPTVLGVEPPRDDLDIILRAWAQLTLRFHRPDVEGPEGILEIISQLQGKDAPLPSRQILFWKTDEIRKRHMPAGPYRIRASAGEYQATAEVFLVRGEKTVVDLHLREGGVVEGTLHLPDGTPAERMGVECESPVEPLPRGMLTDDKGRFRFVGVPPGEVVVRSRPVGWVAVEKKTTVRSEETASVSLTLSAGGKLRVEVVDARGDPVGGLDVALSGDGGELARFGIEGGGRTRTRADGSLVFIGLKPGKYNVTLIQGDRNVPAGTVTIAEGQTEVLVAKWESE